MVERSQQVLVAVASRHGGTRELAECLADGVRRGLHDQGSVEVRDAATVSDVSGYDGVLIGSSVYRGHWLPEASDLVQRCAIDLWRRPVWLFSSGPVGRPPRPPVALIDVDRELTESRAREHRVLGGAISTARLSRWERWGARLWRMTDGDDRDWPAVRAWGEEIGSALAGVGPEGS